MLRIQAENTVGTAVSQWGEGPVWWRDRLYYVDIHGKKLRSFQPATGAEEEWEAGEELGCVVPRASGGLVVAGDDGISFFDPATGAKTPVCDPEADIADNRFNDGKCDPRGRFWAGTLSKSRTQGAATLYCLERDLSISTKFSLVTVSNGLGWTADQQTFYYIDTPRKQVLGFDYEGETGAITNPRPVVDTRQFEGSPDGLAIDEAGRIWVAFCHGGIVRCFDPGQSGAVVAEITLPCVECTAVAFGGPELKDLYITTGVNPKLEEPLAGRLFVIPMDVAGLAAHAFGG